MSVDLSQFHQVFFEESFEGLDIMETGLLSLSEGSTEIDEINTIFRAAHSIKGGAGTFGFQMVSDFTHVVETLLDDYRSEKRTVSQIGIDLLLESVDVLRDMLTLLQANSEPDMEAAADLKSRFEEHLSSDAAPTEKTPTPVTNEPIVSDISTGEETEHSSTGNGAGGFWRIIFEPSTDIVQTGNEPFRLIRELAELGDVETKAFTDSIPEFAELNPENIYLHWQIDLHSDCSESAIADIFEWVIDDSKVVIDRISSVTPVHTVADKVDEVKEVSAVEEQSAVAESPSAPPPKSRPVKAESQSIRVSIEKIDSLINMVGELVITQSMLGEIGNNFSQDKLQRLQEGLLALEQNTREMQESVMRIRMVPISFTFSRFPRLVRDIAQKLGKKVSLKLKGENTELDKTVMEKIGDPLVHMVRNSMDHGLESPEKRRAAGKPEEGILILNAYHQGGNIVIEIIDDGNGIDPEIIRKKAIQNDLIREEDQLTDQQLQELIFHPGLSTAEEVSDLSGRGVGMDVVKRNIQELKGTVELESTLGQGTVFRIKLPLTLSILDGQLVKLGDETFVLPLTSIIESIEVTPEQVNTVAGETDVIVLRDEYVPVVRLFDVFNIVPESTSLFDGLVVVVESGADKVGIHVDDLLAQQQVVIKSLDTNYHRVEGLSGATILGDGTVALIVDIAGLMTILNERMNGSMVQLKSATTAEAL